VLNAFRHQRKNHEQVKRLTQQVNQCSTPFGINERTTLHRPPDRDNPPVLNAFRHQRKNHDSTRQKKAYLQRVLNAFRHQRKNHKLVEIERNRRDRCSTPFGINERTTGFFLLLLIAATSAQRLSASTKEPQTPLHRERAGPDVLNAFRHQRKNHHKSRLTDLRSM